MSLFDPANRKLLKTLAAITAAGCLLFLLGLPYGLGFLAGTALAVFMYEWNVRYWNRVLDTGHARRGTGFPHFLINYALMAGLMILAVHKSAFLNIFAVAGGLLTVKSAIIVKELLPGKEATDDGSV